MKKKLLYFIVPISTIVIIVSVLFLIFSFGSGQRNYHSELSGIDVEIPAYSLFVEEFYDENAYTIQFKMLGSEEHILNELVTIENEAYNNNIYTIDQCAVTAVENERTVVFKTVVIVYVPK